MATQYYEKNSGLSALFQYAPMLTQTMLFYFKRPKPRNNSGANYPRDIKFCTRTQVWWLHNIMKKNSGFSALFQYAPIYAHVNADYDILFKKTQALK